MKNHLRGQVAALLLVLVGFLATYTLWPHMKPTELGFFYLAIAFSSWFFGRAAGITATVTSILLITYFFVAPRGSLNPEPEGWIRLAVFFTVSLFLSGASISRRNALDLASNEARRLRTVQQELALSELRWRTLAESLPNLVFTCRPDGACDYISAQWRDYTGIPEFKQVGYKWLNAIHSEDRDLVCQRWDSAIEARRTYDCDCRMRRFDGTYRWFKIRALPIRDVDGNVSRWVGTCTDIHEVSRDSSRLHTTAS